LGCSMQGPDQLRAIGVRVSRSSRFQRVAKHSHAWQANCPGPGRHHFGNLRAGR
jgi:hypothetical protein